MGANNSKPQTVQIPNTSPFQISREVLERVEKATKAEKGPVAVTNPVQVSVASTCEQCNCKSAAAGDAAGTSSSDEMQAYQQKQMEISSSWARRSTEIEEAQFTKTLDRVHNLFGQPIKWAKANECSADIDKMEKQLISCYRQYGKEPLKCAALAKTYHTFVFNKQVAAVQSTTHDVQDVKGGDAN
ncbi:uncharacterized protein LOC6585733 [Drosophila mojavensis]|uniref:MICOS complex subunit MIC19 n=1 Tax=Drosophila mojavensis TaxID=7230 RepID=B4L756_DROMO|nr:uncharacterized protein LOC6585733 [Drosophila mojavensis]EDW06202.1 uncharacterized protein Dmoj_GI16041 [Drosophila mojavensis]